ncbi:hypothetical protein MKEN_01020400 [Mycena kentingensis (nom. inval.)]|nr:hypothetical protein MKEN_01020400 [Mycena kentingensis (nom. inval.)]
MDVSSMAQFEVFTAPILAGTQFNWLLQGTLIVQVYKFHVTFPKERRWVKTLVYTLFVLELAQTAITSHFAYQVLVSSWGNPTVFSILPWSSLAIPIFTGIISAAVQMFYAWRIYYLKGERLWARVVCGIIVLVRRVLSLPSSLRAKTSVLTPRRQLALTQSFSAIITDARFAVTTQISELPTLVVGVKIWLIGSAACDTLITSTLLLVLTDYRRSLTLTRTHTSTLLSRLITSTIETGLITSVVAIADVILFILFSNTNIHQTPAFMLGKLYTNVLMTTLNARRREGGGGGEGGGGEAPSGVNFISEVQWRRYGTRNNTTGAGAEAGTSASKAGVDHIEMGTSLVRKDTDKSMNSKYPAHDF